LGKNGSLSIDHDGNINVAESYVYTPQLNLKGIEHRHAGLKKAAEGIVAALKHKGIEAEIPDPSTYYGIGFKQDASTTTSVMGIAVPKNVGQLAVIEALHKAHFISNAALVRFAIDNIKQPTSEGSSPVRPKSGVEEALRHTT
jgi:hypothetical protein